MASLEGKTAITENDISAWQAAQACYGEGAIVSRKAAFMRLLEAAIAEKALNRAGGVDTGDAVLRAEAARIDKETRAPEILGCVKQKLGDGSGEYMRTFVRPVLIESRLREFIGYNRELHAPKRKLMEDAIKTVTAGKAMDRAATELGLSYSTAAYSVRQSSAPLSPGMVDRGFFEAYLNGLSLGQTRKEPVETESGFIIVRFLSENDTERIYEFASAPKLSQKEWLMTMPKIKLRIEDEQLRLWISSIKGNPRLVAVDLE